MTAIIGLAIAVSVQDRPSAAPPTGPWDKDIVLFASPSLYGGVVAVSTIIFSFGGTPNFLNVLSEMRDPRDYNKSLAVSQSFTTSAYLIIGCVVYYYCGQYVASPALSSAGTLISRVLWGIAFPGLLASSVLNTHMPAKYIFLRIMRRSKYLNSSGWQHWSVWLGCVAFNSLMAFIIAESIPFFSDCEPCPVSLYLSAQKLTLPLSLSDWPDWLPPRPPSRAHSHVLHVDLGQPRPVALGRARRWLPQPDRVQHPRHHRWSPDHCGRDDRFVPVNQGLLRGGHCRVAVLLRVGPLRPRRWVGVGVGGTGQAGFVWLGRYDM